MKKVLTFSDWRINGRSPDKAMGPRVVSIAVKDASVEEVLQSIRPVADLDILVEPGADPPPVTLSFDAVPWPIALDRLAAAAQLVVRHEKRRIRLLPEPRVTLAVSDVGIGEVITRIADQARANVVYGPGLTGAVTMHQESRPWRQVLGEAAALVGHVVVERDGIFRFRPKGAPDPGAVQAKPVLPAVKKALSIYLVDRPLFTVFDWLSENAGVNVVPGPIAEAEKVSIDVEELPWQTMVRMIARRTGCTVRTRGKLVEVVKPPCVTLEFQDAAIDRVVAAIGDRSGASIVSGPELEGTVSVRLEDVPWTSAVDAVLSELGFAIVEERGVYWITTPDRAAKVEHAAPMLPEIEGKVSPRLFDQPMKILVEPFRKGAGVNLIFDAGLAERKITFWVWQIDWRTALELVAERTGCLVVPASADSVRLFASPVVSFDFEDADVRKVLASIAAEAKVEVGCDPGVEGVVSARMNRVPWSTALRCVVRAAGLTLERIDEGTFRVR